jgi:hypothetical protein
MRYLIVFLFLVLLLGCQSVKEKTSAIGEFFDAIASGDIKALKKYKKTKVEDDDESWEEVDNNKEGKT